MSETTEQRTFTDRVRELAKELYVSTIDLDDITDEYVERYSKNMVEKAFKAAEIFCEYENDRYGD